VKKYADAMQLYAKQSRGKSRHALTLKDCPEHKPAYQASDTADHRIPTQRALQHKVFFLSANGLLRDWE